MYLLIAIFLHHSQAVLFKLRTIVIEVEVYDLLQIKCAVHYTGVVIKNSKLNYVLQKYS